MEHRTALTCRQCGTSFDRGIIEGLIEKMKQGADPGIDLEAAIPDECIYATQELAYLLLGLGCGECELGTNTLLTLDHEDDLDARYAVDLIDFLLPSLGELLQFQAALALHINQRFTSLGQEE